MVFSLTTPAMAAAKPKTKTFTVSAGINYVDEDADGNVTFKVTNVTSSKNKDFSVDLVYDGEFEDEIFTHTGKDSKVIYCKGKTTITLQANKGDKTAAINTMYVCAGKLEESIKEKFKYYKCNWDTYKADTSKKYDETPNGGGAIADGSSYTFTKAGNYVIYVRPLQFNGYEGDFELTPIFVVVKK